jgi:hypothetical protein
MRTPITAMDPHHAIPAITDALPCKAYSGQNATAKNSIAPQKAAAALLSGIDWTQRGHRHA